MKRLSDAVIRGFGKINPDAEQYLTWFDCADIVPCGCALGAALLDCITLDEAKAKSVVTSKIFSWRTWGAKPLIRELQVHFPWFTEEHEETISTWFRNYRRDRITFQELIERIREIESPYYTESSPEPVSVEEELVLV